MQSILFEKCIISSHLTELENEAKGLYIAENVLFPGYWNRNLNEVSLSPVP